MTLHSFRWGHVCCQSSRLSDELTAGSDSYISLLKPAVSGDGCDDDDDGAAPAV